MIAYGIVDIYTQFDQFFICSVWLLSGAKINVIKNPILNGSMTFLDKLILIRLLFIRTTDSDWSRFDKENYFQQFNFVLFHFILQSS